MSRRGFTLMELLVVISVIAVLASLAIPAIGYAKKMANKAKAQSQIAQIQAGLESFRINNGTYPEKKPAMNPALTTTSWEDIFQGAGGTAGKNAKDIDTNKDDDEWMIINQDLLMHLSKIDGERFHYKAGDYLRDPFQSKGKGGGIIRYRPARFYPFDSATTADEIDSEDPPGRDSYQLWSKGPDGEDNFDNLGKDDIVSWGKK